MAALAITDDPRRPPRSLALSGRLDAATLADAVARGARGARRRARGDRSSSTRRPSTTATAPASRCSSTCCASRAEASVEVANLKPAHAALLRQFDPRCFAHDLDPEPPRGRAIEEIGRAAAGDLARHPHADRVHRRDRRGARLRGAHPRQRALARRLAHLRARRRRRAADRRADLVPARHDPRVPVGGADEALRRRDLRRRPDRPRRCCASSGR